MSKAAQVFSWRCSFVKRELMGIDSAAFFAAAGCGLAGVSARPEFRSANPEQKQLLGYIFDSQAPGDLLRQSCSAGVTFNSKAVAVRLSKVGIVHDGRGRSGLE
jgi:hypothetical protein